LRTVVIVLAALALAAGGTVAFALPAGAAATQFTATIDTLPVTNATASVAFSGGKPSGSVISSVQIDNPFSQGRPTCTGLGAGSTAWNCTFAPTGNEVGTFNEGVANIEIDVTDAAGTVAHNILSFDVLNDPEYGGPSPMPVAPGATGYALRSYVFTPGAVTITGTPSSEASYVALELEFPGEGWDGIQSCP
jgi:hypothetical protein